LRSELADCALDVVVVVVVAAAAAAEND